MALILPFPAATSALASPIACYIRIGEAHRKLADLHAASRFPATRIVVEASRVRHQRELITAMREAGAEIVLDTETAELSAPARFSGHSHRAPWALPVSEGPLGPDHFQPGARSDVFGKIARFAVATNVDAVLAPAQFLGDPIYREWLAVDGKSCGLLRSALDREGGSDIRIDYPVIIPHTELNNANIRGALTASLVDQPIDNVRFMASGLNSNAGPLIATRYLDAISYFHNLGKPIIADHLGGLLGLAAIAFGTVSGVAHGIGERERFDASAWHKPPEARVDSGQFGRAVRIGIPGLNRSATKKELELLTKANGGRRLISCSDRACCPHGYSDMIADPRRHAVYQAFNAINSLQAVPDLKREHHFLNGPMAIADRRGREIRNLNIPAAAAAECGFDAAEFMKRLNEHSRKLEQTRTALERLHDARGDDAPRARSIGARIVKEPAVREDRP